jgi:predicted DCC family thiol-disulfide oxidoreductase YuxK
MRDEPSGRVPAETVAALLPGGARLLVLYDGWCGVCARAVRWIRRRDRDGRIVALPNQTPGLRERLGLTKEQADASAWALDADGRRYEGAAAVNRALDELGAWRYVATFLQLPLIRQLNQAGYHLFSINRARFSRWGITPACRRPGAGCLSEGT